MNLWSKCVVAEGGGRVVKELLFKKVPHRMMSMMAIRKHHQCGLKFVFNPNPTHVIICWVQLMDNNTYKRVNC